MMHAATFWSIGDGPAIIPPVFTGPVYISSHRGRGHHRVYQNVTGTSIWILAFILGGIKWLSSNLKW